MGKTIKFGNYKYYHRPSWFDFYRVWNAPKMGRFIKRQLSKARRRISKYFIEEELVEDNYKFRDGNFKSWNSECNYRGW